MLTLLGYFSYLLTLCYSIFVNFVTDMSTLLFITSNYPLGGVTEQAFIGPEVDALCREFDRVIFAPITDGDRCVPLPSNATVTRKLAGGLPLLKRLKRLSNSSVWKHILADHRQIKSLGDLRGSIAASVYALHYRDLIRELISEFDLDLNDTLIYTFWFTAPALGASMIKGVKLVSRAHGYDLYHRPDVYLSDSRRSEALEKMLKVYAASKAGAQYLRVCYPGQAEKISAARMGSRDPLGLNPDNKEGAEITLLSVARAEAVKRIPLMCDLLKSWALSRPDLNIRWIHIGDGKELPQVRESAAKERPANMTVEFHGSLSNEDVHRLLASRHVDAVLLTSLSEGGAPIALSEALSYGVPVIATAVGGVPEIVSPEVGALLSPTPTAGEFITVMDRELPLLGTKRRAARERWETDFSATRLRDQFARELRDYLNK